MGTWQGNVNPYPITETLSVAQIITVPITIPLPAGSVVTSGTWSCTVDLGSNTGGYFTAGISTPDTLTLWTSSDANPVITTMTAAEVSQLNSNPAFNVQLSWETAETPVTATVYISVSLTGTFPAPGPPGGGGGTNPPTIGGPPSTGGSPGGVFQNLILEGILDMACKLIPEETRYLSQNVSNYASPFGVQIVNPAGADYIGICTGLVNAGGAGQNYETSVRIYREKIGNDGQWMQNVEHVTQPYYCQLSSIPALIPWDREPVNMFIEFNAVATMPASSSVELTVVRYRTSNDSQKVFRPCD